jgi:DNA repair protein RecN (Recombination protein N)
MAGAVSKKGERKGSLLEEINIRSLGLIDSATIEFREGFNVITGETGAGKTMLLNALALILGQKADADYIRQGQDRAVVSGRFRLPEKISEDLSALINEHEPEIEESSILLSRQLGRDGKSKAQLSGSSTTASTLISFADQLIEIHGQHANLVLTKANKQREILDIFAGQGFSIALLAYQDALKSYQVLRKEIAELKKALGDRDSEIKSLEELVNDFAKLKPQGSELSQLEALISKLESVEDLRIASLGAQQALSDEEAGALNSLHSAKKSLTGAKGRDAQLDQIADAISEKLFDLIDAASDLDRYLDSLSADPQALELAQSRRAALSSFAKKYGSASDKSEALSEAIVKAEGARNRIKDLSGGDDRLAEMGRELEELRAKLLDAAETLSVLRADSAKKLSSSVTKELVELAMAKAVFEVRIESRDGGSDDHFSPFGLDEVFMLFTAHSGGELLPVSKAASGGELSRLMLALEVVLAGSYPLGTYVFDEVDAGVGGKAALEVGRRLRKLAMNSQVIVVTHLPQVALWADNHILVEKDSNGLLSSTSIKSLSDQEREIEIARMLSGIEESEHAQDHARELLNLRFSDVG